jgi:hypothetical protein
MKYIMTDIEADGPAPGIDLYSMVSFAALVVEPGLNRVFFGEVCPISDLWIPEALKVSGYTREQTLNFPEAETVMPEFVTWLEALRADNPKERLMLVSDNAGFDWQFINHYLWRYAGGNPFGHTSQNLGDLYKGMQKDCFQSFKHLRKTRHSHDPRDDVRGNAEAMLEMKRMGLKF